MYEEKRDSLPTLDGWRAVAIFGVLFAHAMQPYLSWAEYGAFGVSLFFGLSGFLITYRLVREHDTNGAVSVGDFYWRRVFRILPPYIAYVVVIVVLGLHRSGFELLSSFLFFRNYLPPEHGGWYLGHFWSLAVEEHFYLVWPGLFALFGVRRSRQTALAIALAVAAWRWADTRFHVTSEFLDRGLLGSRSDIRMDAILMGAWVALGLKDPHLGGLIRRAGNPAVWLALLGVLVFAIADAFPLSGLVASAVVPLLIVGTVVRPSSLVGRFLESALMSWMGRLSYSLYVWQQLFLVPRKQCLVGACTQVQMLPLNLAAALVCAVVSFYAIERPAIELGRRLRERQRRQQLMPGGG